MTFPELLDLYARRIDAAETFHALRRIEASMRNAADPDTAAELLATLAPAIAQRRRALDQAKRSGQRTA